MLPLVNLLLFRLATSMILRLLPLLILIRFDNTALMLSLDLKNIWLNMTSSILSTTIHYMYLEASLALRASQLRLLLMLIMLIVLWICLVIWLLLRTLMCYNTILFLQYFVLRDMSLKDIQQAGCFSHSHTHKHGWNAGWFGHTLLDYKFMIIYLIWESLKHLQLSSLYITIYNTKWTADYTWSHLIWYLKTWPLLLDDWRLNRIFLKLWQCLLLALMPTLQRW